MASHALDLGAGLPKQREGYLGPRPVAPLTLACPAVYSKALGLRPQSGLPPRSVGSGEAALPQPPTRPASCKAAEAPSTTATRWGKTPATALSASRRPLTPRRRRRRRKRGGGPPGPGRGRERHGGGGGRGAPGRAVRARAGPERGPGPLSRECLWAGVREGWHGRGGSPSAGAAQGAGGEEQGQIGGGEGGRGWRMGGGVAALRSP